MAGKAGVTIFYPLYTEAEILESARKLMGPHEANWDTNQILILAVVLDRDPDFIKGALRGRAQ